MATGNRLSVALTVPELTDREGLLKSGSRSKVPNSKVDNLVPPVHHIVQTVDLTEKPEKPKRRWQLERTAFSQSLDHGTAQSIFGESASNIQEPLFVPVLVTIQRAIYKLNTHYQVVLTS